MLLFAGGSVSSIFVCLTELNLDILLCSLLPKLICSLNGKLIGVSEEF